ncbi:uncharacterized protein LOC112576505 isoform X1 [Pomacea canaliculata]|uniref:uncharacterized protein LOC112576505 isoform X1 n=1 Tax=Pomacea canaliculata TaxID=400727 RepID=UPI000D739E47|nr:uncharacterized protein LOC112576505 isoform X1 [Pomacea canaliculata]
MAFEESVYYGVWKIVECVSLAGVVETTGIEGTEFRLDENGDVTWRVSEDAEPMLFFSCETYEITPETGSGSSRDSALLKFIGTYAGHVIEFKAEVTDDLMLLTYEKCCMLQCQKISSNEPTGDLPYTYVSALEQGFFSDLSIKAESGKEFLVHSVILRMSLPEMDWLSNPPPLTGLPEEVLQTMLHYLYCECLPPGLTETTAKACVKTLGKVQGFAQFSHLCETFLKNTMLKQQIQTLISEMHNCFDRIIELFSGRANLNNPESPISTEANIWNNPAKLCYTVRQGLKEAAIASAKLLLLCDLFSKRKCELSRQERHEIMKQAKSRMPVFLKQLHKFLVVLKQHSQTLTAHQRYDFASYLVPEIEVILDTVSRFAVETKVALEQVISSSNAEQSHNEHSDRHEKGEKSKRGNIGEVLGRTLKNALHMRELKKLKKFHDKTTASFVELMNRKEDFSIMTEGDKVRAISKYLEQLIDELPVTVLRLEELIGALEQKVPWTEWKYLFKMATSKISWGLSKVQSNRASLQPLIDEVCDIVRSDQFSAAVATLGLRNIAAENSQEGGACSDGGRAGKSRMYPLNPVESLCVSPFPKDSKMAGRALDLFRKREGSDMVFEIVSTGEGGDIVIDHTGDKPVTTVEEGVIEVDHIPCHRVIVASRCDWFRRALLSGMRESIDKKIVVHDIQPHVFRLFLEALYSGQLDTSSLTTEHLVDMMTLCDRYEMDSLKISCEHALKHHVDEDTALYLLSLADQLGCTSLQDYVLIYIANHPQLVHSDVYEDLPDKLKEDVEDAIAWKGLESERCREPSRGMDVTPSSVSSMSELEDLVGNIEVADRTPAQELSSSVSSEDLQLMGNEELLHSCLAALRDVVGDAVPEEELVRVALAADYDVNRAVNFFFLSS